MELRHILDAPLQFFGKGLLCKVAQQLHLARFCLGYQGINSVPVTRQERLTDHILQDFPASLPPAVSAWPCP
jgi:hypothetical protein